jgi:hypothetical protein
MPSIISKVKEIQSYNFTFKDEFYKDVPEEEIALMRRTEFGFIAQELQKIFPELVYESKEEEGMLSVNYVSMIPILTSAIKELSEEVETLKKALAEIGIHVEPKSNGVEDTKTTLYLNLQDNRTADVEEMIVYQNAPNPFNENTFVKCYIPKSIKKAQLCVYNMQGAQLKCLDIAERGAIDIKIEAGTLASGIYTYILIGDGKTSDAKNMILTK